MSEPNLEARLKTVSGETLTPLVQNAQKSRTFEVTDWNYEPVHGGSGELFDAGLFRFFGNGHDRGEVLQWTLLLKIIRAETELTSNDPSTWNYWKREALAYQSELLDDLPGDLKAPRCYSVHEQTDDEIWIWLEEIAQQAESTWSLDRYRLAARHLGQFNGAYLVNRTMPSYWWLSKGRIIEWLDESSDIIPRLHQYLEYPLIARWFADDSTDRMTRLWSQREYLLEALGDLPRTLCHHDAFRRNLIANEDENSREITVAVDWSMIGPGVIGEEIATMHGVSLQFLDIDPDLAPELDSFVYNGYLTGLRDAGWDGDPNLVRFGFTAAAALFMGLGAAGAWLPTMIDESERVLVEQLIAQPIENIADQWSKMQIYLLDLGDEALALREVIS